MSGLRSDIYLQSSTYELSGAYLPKNISDTARLQHVVTDLLHQYCVLPDK